MTELIHSPYAGHKLIPKLVATCVSLLPLLMTPNEPFYNCFCSQFLFVVINERKNSLCCIVLGLLVAGSSTRCRFIAGGVCAFNSRAICRIEVSPTPSTPPPPERHLGLLNWMTDWLSEYAIHLSTHGILHVWHRWATAFLEFYWGDTAFATMHCNGYSITIAGGED